MAATKFDEGTVTILFTDVEGATDLGTRTGDEPARKVLRSHEELIREVLAEHGGREVKNLGDGFMLAFGSARRAVACAVAIQRELERKRRVSSDAVPLVRMGLNSGEAIHEEGDLFGSAVSAAARISAKAKGGEILVSEVVKFLAGNDPGIAFVERGRFKLKGFEERWRLFQVEWQEEESGTPTSDRTPFVAREEEKAELLGHLDRLAEHRGGVVVIGGEPGVGKTRLAEEILAAARDREFRTLTGRCYEMDSPPPYLPFVELLEQASREVDKDTFRLALGESAGEVAKVMPQLRNLFDDLPPPLELPPEQERRYLFNSIQEFVQRAASVRPLVVLLDDVHWADESSTLLMQHIADAIKESAILIIATYRDVELDTARPLARTLDYLARTRTATRMSLRRLSEEGTAAMLTKLAGTPPPQIVAGAIFNETDGNAFFVEEVFRHLVEEGRLLDGEGSWRTDLTIDELEVPEGVRLVIGRRLERLAEDTVKILTTAAVIGRHFSFELLELTSDADTDHVLDAVDEATTGHLIAASGSGTEFSFVHELIRQTLLSRVSMPRRQRLHQKVAQSMAKLFEGRESERAAEIAHHFYQAGAAADPFETVRFMTLAGDNALEAAAFEDALRFYEEALGFVEDSDDQARAKLLFLSGSALRSRGRLEESMQRWREALNLHEAGGRRLEAGQIAAEIGLQLGWAGYWAETLEIAGRGLNALGEEDSAERARLLGLGGIALSWAGSYEQATPMIEEAVRVAQRVGDKRALGEALVAEGVHEYAYLDFVACAALCEQGAKMLDDEGAVWDAATAKSFLLFSLALLQRDDEVRALLPEVEELGNKLGHVGAILFSIRVKMSLTRRYEPDLEEWEELARTDVEVCRQHELPWIAQGYSNLGWARFTRGYWDEGIELLEKGAAEDPPGALWGYGLGLLLVAVATAGDRSRTIEILDQAREHLPDPTERNTAGRWILAAYFVEAAWLFGLEDDLRRIAPIIEKAIEIGFIARFDGRPMASLAGLVDAGLDRWESAESRLQEGIDQARPDSIDVFEVQRLGGQAFLRRGRSGDLERATELLEKAARGYEALGASKHAEVTRTMIATGADPSAAPI